MPSPPLPMTGSIPWSILHRQRAAAAHESLPPPELFHREDPDLFHQGILLKKGSSSIPSKEEKAAQERAAFPMIFHASEAYDV